MDPYTNLIIHGAPTGTGIMSFILNSNIMDIIIEYGYKELVIQMGSILNPKGLYE